jgi:ABC-type uncharacterized transport system YnjBCD ATPase subunit
MQRSTARVPDFALHRISLSNLSHMPKEQLSATERARLAAQRASSLERHMLPAGAHSPASVRAAPSRSRLAVLTDLRDAQEFTRGVEVQILPDSAFGRLFPDRHP